MDRASQEPHCSLAALATKAPRGWNVLLLAVELSTSGTDFGHEDASLWVMQAAMGLRGIPQGGMLSAVCSSSGEDTAAHGIPPPPTASANRAVGFTPHVCISRLLSHTSPLGCDWSQISPVHSSPEPASFSLSAGTTPTVFGGDIKSHPIAVINGAGPALGHPTVTLLAISVPIGTSTKGFSAAQGSSSRSRLLRLAGCSSGASQPTPGSLRCSTSLPRDSVCLAAPFL